MPGEAHSCPLCAFSTHAPSHLKRHLICAHFRKAILSWAGVVDLHRCPLCACAVAAHLALHDRQAYRPAHFETFMANHLVLKHDALNRVLPGEVKDALGSFMSKKLGATRGERAFTTSTAGSSENNNSVVRAAGKVKVEQLVDVTEGDLDGGIGKDVQT